MVFPNPAGLADGSLCIVRGAEGRNDHRNRVEKPTHPGGLPKASTRQPVFATTTLWHPAKTFRPASMSAALKIHEGSKLGES